MSCKNTHYIKVNGKVEKFFRGVKKAGVTPLSRMTEVNIS